MNTLSLAAARLIQETFPKSFQEALAHIPILSIFSPSRSGADSRDEFVREEIAQSSNTKERADLMRTLSNPSGENIAFLGAVISGGERSKGLPYEPNDMAVACQKLRVMIAEGLSPDLQQTVIDSLLIAKSGDVFNYDVRAKGRDARLYAQQVIGELAERGGNLIAIDFLCKLVTDSSADSDERTQAARNRSELVVETVRSLWERLKSDWARPPQGDQIDGRQFLSALSAIATELGAGARNLRG